jgi:hypothetical protein
MKLREFLKNILDAVFAYINLKFSLEDVTIDFRQEMITNALDKVSIMKTEAKTWLIEQ